MNEISAKYFSTKFIVENKLKLTDIVILEYIYSWILSDNPPEFKMESGKKAFYLSQSHIADDFSMLITQPAISQKMKRLEKCGIVETKIIDSFKGKFYVVFNWEKVLESLASKELLEKQKYKYCSNWFEKIYQYISEERKNEDEWKKEWNKKSMYEKIEYYQNEEKKYKKEIEDESYNKNMNLLDSGIEIKKTYYCKEADSIARRILTKYSNFFVTKYPIDGAKPTKTYIRLCRKIEDIYNGNFINSRFYNFNENIFKNRQFETEGWKEKIKEVKGDWVKVKKLIFGAVNNFILMFNEDRMPLSKIYLTNNLNNWFFSDDINNKGQSQFIQSLNEPMFTRKKLGLNKAKNIVEKLKEGSPVSYLSGHELNELLPDDANEAVAWDFILKIIKWGKLLYQYDENAKYFLQCEIDGKLEHGPQVLPALFARYLLENQISVSLNTLNIEQAVGNNAPWCWFIDKACKEHDMNRNISKCSDNDDFYDAYTYNKSDDEFPVF